MTTKAIKAIARNCRKLTSLYVLDCGNLTDSAITEMREKNPSLQIVANEVAKEETARSL